MRKFNLSVNNGVAVVPTTLSVAQVEQRLRERSGGLMHVVAYTNAKPLKKAKELGMDLVKIVDCMCINGLPKREPNTQQNDNRREAYFTRLSYSTIQYLKSGEKAITPHLSNNPKHRAKSYYIDLNTGRLYDKSYLVENGYISSSTSNFNENEIHWLQFKFENIIAIN